MSQHESPLLPPDRPRPTRLGATLKALFRARLTAGLIIVLPVYLTILVVRFVFNLMRNASQWAVEWFLHSRFGAPLLKDWGVSLSSLRERLGHAPSSDELLASLPPHIRWSVYGLSVLLTIFLLYLIGMLTANIFGRRLVVWLEFLVGRVPLAKTVYNATKHLLTSFTNEAATNFQRVALVPFPGSSVRTIGFVTSSSTDAASGEEICTVYVPHTPIPTTGFVFVLRRADIIELPWSVEEAIKVIISGGSLVPPSMVFQNPQAAGRAAIRHS